MARKSKREIERILEDLGESVADDDVTTPFGHDLSDATLTILDSMTGIDVDSDELSSAFETIDLPSAEEDLDASTRGVLESLTPDGSEKTGETNDGEEEST